MFPNFLLGRYEIANIVFVQAKAHIYIKLQLLIFSKPFWQEQNFSYDCLIISIFDNILVYITNEPTYIGCSSITFLHLSVSGVSNRKINSTLRVYSAFIRHKWKCKIFLFFYLLLTLKINMADLTLPIKRVILNITRKFFVQKREKLWTETRSYA